MMRARVIWALFLKSTPPPPIFNFCKKKSFPPLAEVAVTLRDTLPVGNLTFNLT